MAAPFGQILVDSDDFDGVRGMLAFETWDLTDELIGSRWVLGAAERHVMNELPSWQLIMTVGAPAAPATAAPANAGSQLVAGTYYVVLVAHYGTATSPPGVEGTQAVIAGQALQVTPPIVPGVTGWDLYVGVAAGQEYLQVASLPGGAAYQLLAFRMTGTPIGTTGPVGGGIDPVEIGDIANLKAATMAACCAFLCRRMQRAVPREFRTLSMAESIDVNWREEEAMYFDDVRLHLGLVSTYLPSLNPPPAALGAHPNPTPNDPEYQGTDPNALPGTFGIFGSPPAVQS